MAFSDFSYSGKSYSLPGSIQADAIYVGDNDSKLFVLDASTETVHQLDFGTAKEVDTLSDSGVSLDVSSAPISNADLFVNSDLLVVGCGTAGGADAVTEFDLSGSWAVDTGAIGDGYENNSGSPFGFCFGDSGTVLIFSYGSPSFEENALTTGYDLNTASFVEDHSLAGLEFNQASPRFYSDGSYFLFADSTKSQVEAFSLGAAFDLGSAGTAETPLDVSGETSGINGIALSSDDSRLYVADGAGATIYQYDGVATANTENSDSLTARYVDLESREPKPTALIAPGDVQRSIDTHIQNLLDFTHEWTCPIAVQIDELDNYVMGDTFNLTADAPGLRSGKNLRLVEIDATSALPHVPIRFTFRGKP